jgi:hypothetical protein
MRRQRARAAAGTVPTQIAALVAQEKRCVGLAALRQACSLEELIARANYRVPRARESLGLEEPVLVPCRFKQVVDVDVAYDVMGVLNLMSERLVQGDQLGSFHRCNLRSSAPRPIRGVDPMLADGGDTRCP